MAAFQKFEPFVQYLTRGVFNFTSDATSTITVALTNAANPPLSTNGLLADLTQISYTNFGSRVATITSSTQTAGVMRLILNDITLTVSGGAGAPFRYIVFYDDDPTSPADPLIGFYDYGSDLTLPDGASLLIDLSPVNGLFSLS